MGIWNASIPLGGAIGIALGGFIATHWGWRHAFGIVALPGLICAILFFFIKDYKTVDLMKTVDRAGGQKVKMKAGDIMRDFMHTPSLILTYLGFSAMVFTTTSLLTWLPTYFLRVHEINESQAGFKASLVMLLALVGAPLGGFLADRWLKKRANARLLYSAIAGLASAVVLFTALQFANLSIQYVFLLLLGICVTSFIPAAAAVTQDVVHPGLRAISYSICVIFQNLLGASLGPLVVGALSDKYGIRVALSSLPIFMLIAAILFFAGSFFYVRDYNKVEKVALEIEN
jgi:MFS family permease